MGKAAQIPGQEKLGGVMTTKRAFEEIDEAKRILDKHWRAGIPMSITYDQCNGFQYGFINEAVQNRDNIRNCKNNCKLLANVTAGFPKPGTIA